MRRIEVHQPPDESHARTARSIGRKIVKGFTTITAATAAYFAAFFGEPDRFYITCDPIPSAFIN